MQLITRKRCYCVPNNDNYNVFSIKSEHPEQSKSVNDTYPIEQDEHNVIIDSLDMSYDREQVDQDDDDDLANERDLLASLIKKLKCEIDDNKHRNKFLETSNKALVDKLKGEIEDFKNKNKSLQSSNNHFKEANNELSKTNQLMIKDHKKFQAEIDRYHDVNLNTKTSNVNFICVTCGKCVLNDNHDNCGLHSLNDVNSRTKMPMAVPISTREPKRIVNQSVIKPLRRTVASESTNQKSRHTTMKLYELVSKLVEIILFIVDSGCSKHMTGYLKILTNFMEKFMGTVKFGNDQIAPILGYGDLGNGILTGSRGTDLYSITLQDTSSPYPICLMAKATSSQAWLWHRRLSHLNFNTINLLSKNDIVIGLLKLKFVKDHFCS
nr:hypothetical protein [Tanacetum cinerariifolium]